MAFVTPCCELLAFPHSIHGRNQIERLSCRAVEFALHSNSAAPFFSESGTALLKVSLCPVDRLGQAVVLAQKVCQLHGLENQ